MDATPTDHTRPRDTGFGPGDPADPTGIRSLRRSSDDRILGGVAGGVAGHFGIDPVLVRLGFVATTFLGGIGVVAYLVAWVVLPTAPRTDGASGRGTDRRQLLGYALVALGLAVVPGRLRFAFHDGGAFWPLALIALGVAVLWLRTRDHEPTPTPDDPEPPDRDDPDGGGPGPAPRDTGSRGAESTGRSGLGPTGTAVATTAVTPLALPGPAQGTTHGPAAEPPAGPPPPGWDAPESRPAPAPARPRSPLGAITASALLVLAGTSWLLDVSGAVDVDLGVVLASALALVGVALIVSAWFGRARKLIVLGLPLLLVVAGLGLVDVPLRGGVGDPSYSPRVAADVRSTYELAVGALTVDLRHVDLTGDHRTVRALVGIGQLNVVVPPGTRVVVDGHAGVGSVTTFGQSTRECCPTDVRRVHAPCRRPRRRRQRRRQDRGGRPCIGMTWTHSRSWWARSSPCSGSATRSAAGTGSTSAVPGCWRPH